jgi:hypothetical protein
MQADSGRGCRLTSTGSGGRKGARERRGHEGGVAGGALADWQGGRQASRRVRGRADKRAADETGRGSRQEAGGSRQFWGRLGKRQLRAGVQSALCATGTSYDGVVVEGSRWMWDRMQSCGLAGGGRRGGAGAGAEVAAIRGVLLSASKQEASKQAGVAGDGCGCSVLAVPSTAGNGHSRRVGQWGRVVVVGSWPSLGAGEDGQTCN